MEYGLYMKHCKVEVYLLEFKMCIHPDINNIKKRQFSRADTVGEEGSKYTMSGRGQSTLCVDEGQSTY